MCEPATIALIISAVAASAGTASAVSNIAGGPPSAPKLPSLAPAGGMPTPTPPPTRQQLGGDISRMAGRGLGGAAPAFFQGLQGPEAQGADTLAQIDQLIGLTRGG